MEIVEYKEDRVWESVLDALSDQGRLGRFNKIPKHELHALLRAHGGQSTKDLSQVFALTQSSKIDSRKDFLERAGEFRIFAMLFQVIHCMRCWVETDSPVQTVRKRWKIANS